MLKSSPLSQKETFCIFIFKNVEYSFFVFLRDTSTEIRCIGERESVYLNKLSPSRKIKVKVFPQQAMKAQRVSRGIALLFLDLGA